MAKRKEPKLCHLFEKNPDRNEQDRLSFLPDELLVQILSYLTLRQAVNTGVLTKRWMNLWTKIPCLTLDGLNMFDLELSCATQRLKTRQFVSRVDSLVSQMVHRSLPILSFSVYYEMTEDDVSHIDQWVSFAMDHDAEKLNLFFRRKDTINWSFPPQMASNEKLCSLRELRLGGAEIAPTFAGFKNLKLLSLTSVCVTNEAFDDLMSNCLLLVDLFVCSAKNLKSIKIPESMVRLRFLHIYLCPDLLDLEVNAPNLVIFSFIGDKIEFSFENISKLLLLRLAGLDEVFSQLMIKNSMLQTLSLDLDLFFGDFNMDFNILPTLTNLKMLSLSVVRLSNGFAGVVNVLQATPSLIKFGLHLKDPDFVTHELNEPLTGNFRHKCLRQMELSGFSGGEGHIELACFLIKIAVSLEKFTIFPYHIRFYLNQCVRTEPDIEQLAAIRKCIERISCKLPSTVKLEFIEC